MFQITNDRQRIRKYGCNMIYLKTVSGLLVEKESFVSDAWKRECKREPVAFAPDPSRM